MSVILRHPWTSQPQVAVGIANTPIANGIVLANTPVHGLSNAAGGAGFTQVGTVTVKMGPAGLGWSNFSNSNYLSWTIPKRLANATSGTAMLVSDMPASGTTNCIWQLGTTATATQDNYTYSNDAIYCATLSNSRYISGQGVPGPGGVAQLLRPNVYIAQCAGNVSTLSQAWVNGYSVGGVTNQTFSPGTTATFGSDTVNGGHSGKFYLLVVWNRYLSQAEVASLSVNPWQIFSPTARTGWFSLGSNITYTLTSQLMSSSTGTISSSLDAALIGSLSNLSAGIILPSTSYTLVGTALVTSQGTVTQTGGIVVPIYNANGNYYIEIDPGLSVMHGMFKLPSWTTAGRPVSAGDFTAGYNTDTGKLELWTGAVWVGVTLT